MAADIVSPADGDTIEPNFDLELSSTEEIGEPDTGLLHYHVFIDGDEEDYEILYDNSHNVERNLSPGDHTIEAALANPDHSLVDGLTVLVIAHIAVASGVLPGYRGAWRAMHWRGQVPIHTARRLWPATVSNPEDTHDDPVRQPEPSLPKEQDAKAAHPESMTSAVETQPAGARVRDIHRARSDGLGRASADTVGRFHGALGADSATGDPTSADLWTRCRNVNPTAVAHR